MIFLCSVLLLRAKTFHYLILSVILGFAVSVILAVLSAVRLATSLHKPLSSVSEETPREGDMVSMKGFGQFRHVRSLRSRHVFAILAVSAHTAAKYPTLNFDKVLATFT